MGDFISEFFLYDERNICNLKLTDKTNTEIAAYKKQLKKTLSKKQRRLLLRLEDEKDLLIDKCTAESFAAGFKLGLKIGYEANKE